MMRVTCYDGVGCIGGNKILLEDGDTKLWLDFGLNFSRQGKFYEEFVKPKPCTGIYEPIQMGLLPPFRDLYRDDLVSDLADPWDGIEAQNLGDVHGILTSHGHLDHIGMIAYVRPEIPIYSSAMTLAMSKAMQDTGQGLTTHYCYVTPYEPCPEGELKSAPTATPSEARPYVLVDEEPSVGLKEFWGKTPGSESPRGRPYTAREMVVSSKCGELSIRRFPVDHSVYGASAWAVETSVGWAVYTGDIRCHGSQGKDSLKFAEEAAKLNPIALIIEGTRIDSDSTRTEEQVRLRALEEVEKAEGLVVADFGARNIERLKVFYGIAKETGRKLCVTLKDAYLMESMALADENGSVPLLDDPAISIYCKYEAASGRWKDVVKEKHDQAKFCRASDVAASQNEYICCFSFFDANELAYIKPVNGSVWIYSSCEPFNEEMQIDMDRLLAWVREFGMSFPSGESQDERSPFHVSGHASRHDLIELVKTIRPRRVIPVHCTQPNIYVEALNGICSVTLPEVGHPIVL